MRFGHFGRSFRKGVVRRNVGNVAGGSDDKMNIIGKEWKIGSLFPELRTKAPKVERKKDMVRGRNNHARWYSEKKEEQ